MPTWVFPRATSHSFVASTENPSSPILSDPPTCISISATGEMRGCVAYRALEKLAWTSKLGVRFRVPTVLRRECSQALSEQRYPISNLLATRRATPLSYAAGHEKKPY